MLKALLALLLPMSVAAPVLAAEPAIEVMVLGTYHFGNPGLDINNMTADDVRTRQRQLELAALTQALLEFKPTKVMVERQVDAATLEDPRFNDFTPTHLTTSTNETVQIGYRLARAAGLGKVYAIDEQPKAGEPDYFPYDAMTKTAARLGQSARLDSANAEVQSFLKRFEAAQATQSIAQLLATMNDPEVPISGIGAFYYRALGMGDTESQPGADLNAMWYLRNAKIFAKLMHVAKPGDRIIVVYGSGHGYWLRHFARETPGFASVDVLPYLKRAAQPR